ESPCPRRRGGAERAVADPPGPPGRARVRLPRRRCGRLARNCRPRTNAAGGLPTARPAAEHSGVGEGTAAPSSSPECRRDKSRPAFGRPQPAAPSTSEALPPTAASFLAAHTPSGGMTMNRKTLKFVVAGVVVAGAFGAIALRGARATPPSPGFVS